VIKGLKEEAITMVLVTHSMSLARELADRIAYVCEGEIAEVGSASQILDAPQHPSLKEFLRRIR